MTALVGLDAKLYRGTAGSTASTEMTNVRDVKWGKKKSLANISRRGSRHHVDKVTRVAHEITFTMINDDADTDLAALRTAFNADTPLAFRILDKTSGKGLDADFEISVFDEDQPDEGEQTVAVTIVPTYVTRWPAYA